MAADQMHSRQGKADYSRKVLDELQEFVKRYGTGAGVDKAQETTSRHC
jgi:hypothetical protein